MNVSWHKEGYLQSDDCKGEFYAKDNQNKVCDILCYDAAFSSYDGKL